MNTSYDQGVICDKYIAILYGTFLERMKINELVEDQVPKQKGRSYHSQDEGLGMGRAGNDFESSWVEGRGFFTSGLGYLGL